MKLLHKLGTAIAALSLGIFGFAAPAQASYGGDCNFAAFCLYQWQNYGSPTGNRWQSSYNNIYAHNDGGLGGCLNIAPATWTNGDPVADNAGSLQSIGTTSWAGYAIFIYNWTNCNPGGGAVSYNIGGGGYEQFPDLSVQSYSLNSPGYPLYHSITSVRVEYLG